MLYTNIYYTAIYALHSFVERNVFRLENDILKWKAPLRIVYSSTMTKTAIRKHGIYELCASTEDQYIRKFTLCTY